MDIERENIDLFDRYLRGDLPEDQKSELEQKLEKDASLRKEFEEYKDVVAAIQYKARMELVGQLKAEAKDVSLAPYLRIAAGIFVTIALGIAVYLLLPNSQEPDYFAAYYTPYEDLTISKSRGGTSDVEEAYNLYLSGKAGQAIDLLSQYEYLEQDPEAMTVMGLSQMSQGNWQSAISQLEEALSFDQPYQNDLYWYLSIAYLEMGDTESAKQILSNITNDPVYSNRVQDIMRQIN